MITGYYADTAEVTAQTVTQEDITIPVVYKELGKIVPVDPEGNPIPDAPTPTYNNDPNDPTKGGETPVTQTQTTTQTTTQKQTVKAITATELPQTGDEEDTTQTLLGVTLLAGLAGLVGFGKKRKTKS